MGFTPLGLLPAKGSWVWKPQSQARLLSLHWAELRPPNSQVAV